MNHIRQTREALGKGRGWLAMASGVSYSFIRLLESKNPPTPGLDAARAISDALGKPLEELFPVPVRRRRSRKTLAAAIVFLFLPMLFGCSNPLLPEVLAATVPSVDVATPRPTLAPAAPTATAAPTSTARTPLPPAPTATEAPCPPSVDLFWSSPIEGQRVAGVIALQCATHTNELRACVSRIDYRYALGADPAYSNPIASGTPRGFLIDWDVSGLPNFQMWLWCTPFDLDGNAYGPPTVVSVNVGNPTPTRTFPPDEPPCFPNCVTPPTPTATPLASAR